MKGLHHPPRGVGRGSVVHFFHIVHFCHAPLEGTGVRALEGYRGYSSSWRVQGLEPLEVYAVRALGGYRGLGFDSRFEGLGVEG